MANEPLRRTHRTTSRPPEDAERPKIWAEGSQRPPFDLRALGRSSLHLARLGVFPLHGWAATRTRTLAEKVRDGAGRIPEAKLGRAARFVPSHLRVAAWIKNVAAVLAHASASTDPEVARGNGLVAAIEPHLWEMSETAVSPAETETAPVTVSEPWAYPAVEPASEAVADPGTAAPVALPEPMQPGDDPLASIRDEIADQPLPGRKGRRGRTEAPGGPALPPAPAGPLTATAIQVLGYLLGWATAILALPYGLLRALWMFARGEDLRKVGREG